MHSAVHLGHRPTEDGKPGDCGTRVARNKFRGNGIFNEAEETGRRYTDQCPRPVISEDDQVCVTRGGQP